MKQLCEVKPAKLQLNAALPCGLVALLFFSLQVGDSRAVLGRLVGSTWQANAIHPIALSLCLAQSSHSSELKAMPLTTDLKPEMPEEYTKPEILLRLLLMPIHPVPNGRSASA